MESESKNLEFTERDRKKKKKKAIWWERERERETKQRTCEFGSRSMEGSRFTGWELLHTQREREREREREGDRYFEAQTVRNRIRVFENNKKKKEKKRKMKNERFWFVWKYVLPCLFTFYSYCHVAFPFFPRFFLHFLSLS